MDGDERVAGGEQGAVQGHRFGQYWLGQPVIVALIVALIWLGDRLRQAARPTTQVAAMQDADRG
jgi:hypothetical protein